jgi:hypothetical protein
MAGCLAGPAGINENDCRARGCCWQLILASDQSACFGQQAADWTRYSVTSSSTQGAGSGSCTAAVLQMHCAAPTAIEAVKAVSGRIT